jgi:glycosyltransferase involved in cell wall biosynthesis
MEIKPENCCIIIAAFNESENIEKVLSELAETNYQVVVVDDGSTDNTASLIDKNKFYFLQHQINCGQGAAVQTGIEFARSNEEINVFITMDADGQHQTKDLASLIKPIQNGNVDVVLGSRFLDKRTKLSLLRRVVLKAAVVFSKLSTGLPLSDAHNGLRAFSRNIIFEIDLKRDGMTHASEILEIVAEKNLNYQEVAVEILYPKFQYKRGQSLWNSVNILSDLFFK